MRYKETPSPPLEDDAQQYLQGDFDDDNEWEDIDPDEHTEAIIHAIRNIMATYSGIRRVRDKRMWRQRVLNAEKNWQAILPQLADAYLNWRYSPNAGLSPDQIDVDYEFTIKAINIYTMTSSLRVLRTLNQSACEALVRRGYLGNSPVNPSLAVSLKTLELLCNLKLVKPSFSFEAYAKLICLIYYIPYCPSYRTAIADTFTAYLKIQCAVQKRVMNLLCRNSPDWRAKHACPACSYELTGEEPPTFSRIICMDGNNSLKRLVTTAGRSAGDTRVFEESDYFLLWEFIDHFANEVKSRQAQPKVQLNPHAHSPDCSVPSSDDKSDGEDGEHAGGEGDPTDGATTEPLPCAKNWKAAAAEEKKRSWGIFDEMGVFVSACRHGIIIWIVDMIRSSELAKYALAMVAKVHQVFGGKVMIAYDIGCTFKETVANSCLSAEACELGMRFCVNAFHGYSHSYDCQVVNHPNMIVGMGIEDVEALERVFLASNQLVPVIRYATPYLQHMLIDLHFQQWDHEKYSNLGLMLYNNLVQALNIVNMQAPPLEQTLVALQLTHEDLQRFEEEERKFFVKLHDESDRNLHAITYVEALQELRSATEKLSDVSHRFNSKAPEQPSSLRWDTPRSGATDYDADLSQTRKLETQRRYLRERVKQLTAEVNMMEVSLNITTRWQPTDTMYLEQYNAAAKELYPPCEPLDWSKVSHYAFLEKFTLLQDTNNDLRDKPWSKPAVHKTMHMACHIAQAREEIANISREVRRLHTFIHDEEAVFVAVLDDLQKQNSNMHSTVLDYVRHWRAANARNLAYVLRIY
ncbi:hypothetical protein BN946_scf184662.g5 [Trametes cinnabarina]|uniref:CxC1-like cysteine cluster associated with KDZ transposases domain-containing protein n=1 Tax=Pycnoporus cinnabarinus TaxID=5643 RepID=A0A060S561_PYCCI|nr:hypothetical protein BN946_scf184662.g5 [Trametes cinnabarina]